MFDVAQTEGEPLPELEPEATGDAGDLVSLLTDAADDLGMSVEIVNADEWEHGKAMGVCRYQYAADQRPVGTSGWIPVGRRSTSRRGKTTTRRRFRVVPIGSVRPPRRSSTLSSRNRQIGSARNVGFLHRQWMRRRVSSHAEENISLCPTSSRRTMGPSIPNT